MVHTIVLLGACIAHAHMLKKTEDWIQVILRLRLAALEHGHADVGEDHSKLGNLDKN